MPRQAPVSIMLDQDFEIYRQGLGERNGPAENTSAENISPAAEGYRPKLRPTYIQLYNIFMRRFEQFYRLLVPPLYLATFRFIVHFPRRQPGDTTNPDPILWIVENPWLRVALYLLATLCLEATLSIGRDGYDSFFANRLVSDTESGTQGRIRTSTNRAREDRNHALLMILYAFSTVFVAMVHFWLISYLLGEAFDPDPQTIPEWVAYRNACWTWVFFLVMVIFVSCRKGVNLYILGVNARNDKSEDDWEGLTTSIEDLLNHHGFSRSKNINRTAPSTPTSIDELLNLYDFYRSAKANSSALVSTPTSVEGVLNHYGFYRSGNTGNDVNGGLPKSALNVSDTPRLDERVEARGTSLRQTDSEGSSLEDIMLHYDIEASRARTSKPEAQSNQLRAQNTLLKSL